jgi:hypothetical protein
LAIIQLSIGCVVQIDVTARVRRVQGRGQGRPDVE